MAFCAHRSRRFRACIHSLTVGCALMLPTPLLGQTPGQAPGQPNPAPATPAPAPERKVITGANTRLGNEGVETLKIRYEAGSRTYWHFHEYGQLVLVEDGIGRFQERGGKILEARAGQSYYLKPKTEHWHGASIQEHATLLQVYPKGVHITLKDPVTEDEYRGPATFIP